jgi:hypothetical protein
VQKLGTIHRRPAGSGIMSGMRRRRGGRLHSSLARDTRRRARKAVSRSLSRLGICDISRFIFTIQYCIRVAPDRYVT